MSLVGGQHRQHVRRLARLIRFFVRDQLDRAVIAVGPVGPAVVAVGGVNVSGVRRNPLAVFVNRGFDLNRAGDRDAVIVRGLALRVGRDFG
ncbi:MAG: hypothetical protein JMDDDDMK_01657 [Acidobacteria bacterium]|nr:hypothetical protein [Acidobacteriota bacterium]